MIPCSGVLAVRGEPQVGGHVIMVQGALTFVMLDVVPPTGPLFEASKPQGIQAEQSRS
jgi:hypothetical protein